MPETTPCASAAPSDAPSDAQLAESRRFTDADAKSWIETCGAVRADILEDQARAVRRDAARGRNVERVRAAFELALQDDYVDIDGIASSFEGAIAELGTEWWEKNKAALPGIVDAMPDDFVAELADQAEGIITKTYEECLKREADDAAVVAHDRENTAALEAEAAWDLAGAKLRNASPEMFEKLQALLETFATMASATVPPELPRRLRAAAVRYADERNPSDIFAVETELAVAAVDYVLTTQRPPEGESGIVNALLHAAARITAGDVAGGKDLAAFILASSMDPARAGHAKLLEQQREQTKLALAEIPPDLAEVVTLATIAMHLDHDRFREILGHARCEVEYIRSDETEALVADARARRRPMVELVVGQLDAVRDHAARRASSQVARAAGILAREKRLREWTDLGQRLYEAPSGFRPDTDGVPDEMTLIGVAQRAAERAVGREFVDSYVMPGADQRRIVEWFEARVREALAIGGQRAAHAIWHVLIADVASGMLEVDDFLTEVDVEALVASARHYALLACIGANEYDADKLRALLDLDGIELTAAYAPFGNESRTDVEPSVLLGNAMASMVAALCESDNGALCQALGEFAYGQQQASSANELEPVYRMGVVAWLARRGLVEAEAADDDASNPESVPVHPANRDDIDHLIGRAIDAWCHRRRARGEPASQPSVAASTVEGDEIILRNARGEIARYTITGDRIRYVEAA